MSINNPFTITDPQYTLHEEWFNRSPVLSVIRDVGMGCSTPHGLYIHLLANAASYVRPGVLTPIGTEPNLWVGPMGHTGCGFSTTFATAQEMLALPSDEVMTGTWRGFAKHLNSRRLGADFPGLDFHLDSGLSLRNVLYRYGTTASKQMESMLDSGEITHKKYGREAGTYRVTLRQSIYPPSVSGWLFMREKVQRGYAAKFLFADMRYCPYRSREACLAGLRFVPPTITPANWSVVPDGRLPMPTSAQDAANKYFGGMGSLLDLEQLKLRFSVLVAHASLHGRTVPTDDDWDATEEVMHVSRSLAANYYERAHKWRYSEKEK